MKTDIALIGWLVLFLAAAILDGRDAELLDHAHALRGNEAPGAQRLATDYPTLQALLPVQPHPKTGPVKPVAPQAPVNHKTKRD